MCAWVGCVVMMRGFCAGVKRRGASVPSVARWLRAERPERSQEASERGQRASWRVYLRWPNVQGGHPRDLKDCVWGLR